MVILSVGPALGVELAIIFQTVDILGIGTVGLAAGTVAASEVAARSSRFRPGFVGGLMYALSSFVPFFIFGDLTGISTTALTVLLGDTAFSLAATHVGALTDRSKHWRLG